ncbi:hypothetical protein HYW17_01240 [Candidatus Uhrbacteria bacterium]|nr:hypothetical protein [Candidatus Uhrbacteria bacterium]
MSEHDLVAILKKYKKTGRASAMRRAYFRAFESKMIYRTTKTENPETTRQMVANILHKFR